MKCNISVPAKTLVEFAVKVDLETAHISHLYDIQSNTLLNAQHPNLILLSGIHKVLYV